LANRAQQITATFTLKPNYNFAAEALELTAKERMVAPLLTLDDAFGESAKEEGRLSISFLPNTKKQRLPGRSLHSTSHKPTTNK
jgi:hypothetical protein